MRRRRGAPAPPPNEWVFTTAGRVLERDREPWGPPPSTEVLAARIHVALAEVGQGEELRLQPSQREKAAELYGPEYSHLPTVVNVGRQVPLELWQRAAWLALFGPAGAPWERL